VSADNFIGVYRDENLWVVCYGFMSALKDDDGYRGQEIARYETCGEAYQAASLVVGGWVEYGLIDLDERRLSLAPNDGHGYSVADIRELLDRCGCGRYSLAEVEDAFGGLSVHDRGVVGLWLKRLVSPSPDVAGVNGA